jgi:hypothetical protein
MNRMRPGQIEPNELERAILDHIADAQPALHPRLKDLHVLSREYTGVGSFTTFRTDKSGDAMEEQPVTLKELIHMPGVPSGMGAVLFCERGQADLLEIYTFGDDHWDGVYEGFSIGGAT